MGKESSAKQIAKTAAKGRDQKVRTGGGRVFPAALMAAIVLGALLVLWSRGSARAVANVAPKASAGSDLGDHWHVAFGVFNCKLPTAGTDVSTGFLPDIQRVNEPDDIDGGGDYAVTGIHSHADGVIHVHPFGSSGAGSNAKLGTYFKMVDIKISDESLEVPEAGENGIMKNGEKCSNGKEGKLRVLVWEDAGSTESPQIRRTDFKNTKFSKDFLAITVAFIDEDQDVSVLKPKSAANLAELAQNDGGAAPPSATTTTIAGETTTTVAGDTTTSSSVG